MTASKKTVILLRGSPGSGKSTWISAHLPDATVVSADKFFERGGTYKFDGKLLKYAHESSQTAFKAALARGDALVAVDNTNIHKGNYQFYVTEATKAGYEVYQKVLTTVFQNVHGVPEDKVTRMRDLMEVDTYLPHWPE